MRPGETLVTVLLALVTLLIVVAFFARSDGVALGTLVVLILVLLMALPFAWATMPLDEA